MHVKINYEIFTEKGQLHREKGKNNEDAFEIVSTRDCTFVIAADGFGSQEFAEQASGNTVDFIKNYCFNYGENFFIEKNSNDCIKKMIFDLQDVLYSQADKYKREYKFDTTLIIFAVNIPLKKYITIHVGDGIVAALNEKVWELISLPENGASKSYTYSVTSGNVFDHLRVNFGNITDYSSFFISTDGYFENCSLNKYGDEISKQKTVAGFDDMTYCQIKIDAVE